MLIYSFFGLNFFVKHKNCPTIRETYLSFRRSRENAVALANDLETPLWRHLRFQSCERLREVGLQTPCKQPLCRQKGLSCWWIAAYRQQGQVNIIYSKKNVLSWLDCRFGPSVRLWPIRWGGNVIELVLLGKWLKQIRGKLSAFVHD